MGEISEYFKAVGIIVLATIIAIFIQPILPLLLFPGLSAILAIIVITLILETITGGESEFIGYMGTIIGVLVGGTLLIFLGFSISHLLELPTKIGVPYMPTISSIIELPILSNLHIIEGLIVGFIAAKIKLIISALG